MLVILSPDFDLTNSLFMKRPIGCLYSRPLGALRSMNRSEVILYYVRKNGYFKLFEGSEIEKGF